MPAIGYNPEPSSITHSYKLYPILMVFPFHSSKISKRFLTEIVHIFLLFPIPPTCPVQHNLYFTIIFILGNLYKSGTALPNINPGFTVEWLPLLYNQEI